MRKSSSRRYGPARARPALGGTGLWSHNIGDGLEMLAPATSHLPGSNNGIKATAHIGGEPKSKQNFKI